MKIYGDVSWKAAVNSRVHSRCVHGPFIMHLGILVLDQVSISGDLPTISLIYFPY